MNGNRIDMDTIDLRQEPLKRLIGDFFYPSLGKIRFEGKFPAEAITANVYLAVLLSATSITWRFDW